MKTPMRFVLLLIVAVLLGSCSSDPVDQSDAGRSDAGPDADLEVTPPAPPEIPWLDAGQPDIAPPDIAWLDAGQPPVEAPVHTPCPEGWAEIDTPDTRLVTCEPWPEGGQQECAADEAHFLGEPGCSVIGTRCPRGDWAEDLPSDRPVIYVLAGSPAGGEGSRSSPFGTIAQAIEAATPGTIVALSKGRFDEEVDLPRGVTLWGACTDETVVTCSELHESAPVVAVHQLDTEVRNLRVNGRRRGVVVYATGNVQLEGVVIDGCTGAGLLVEGGDAAGRTLVIRETRRGTGLLVREGGRLDLNRVVLERSSNFGMEIGDVGTVVTMTDVAICDTQGDDRDGRMGMGLRVFRGARVEVTRATLERNRDVGVFVVNPGTTLTMSDVLVRETQSQESDGQFGFGLSVTTGARTDVNRAIFERNRAVGVGACDEGTVLNMSDVVVRDTQVREVDEQFGVGLQVSDQAQVVVERAVFEQNRHAGLLIVGARTTLTLSDALVRDTKAGSDGNRGDGLVVADSARVALSRALFQNNRNAGLRAFDAGTTLVVSDVAVRDTESRESDGSAGNGLYVIHGASVEVRRAIFERNRELGISARGTGTTLFVQDVMVLDTLAQESSGDYGMGLYLDQGAQAEVHRSVFRRNRSEGIYVQDTETFLQMADVVVQETRSRENDHDNGLGLSLVWGPRVVVNRASFEDNLCSGVNADSSGTTLFMTDVLIRGTRSAESDGEFAVGLSLGWGAQVEANRVVIDSNWRVGILVTQRGSTLNVSDVVVRNTRSRESDGEQGAGIAVQDGARFEGHRSVLEGNRGTSVFVHGEGTTLIMSDGVVRDTLEMECTQDTCESFGGGHGVVSLAGAHVEYTRFLITRNAHAGVQLAFGNRAGGRSGDGGTMDLHDGIISNNPIGANVQTEGFDISRLMDRVIYEDNERNLDMTELPVPEMGDPLSDIDE